MEQIGIFELDRLEQGISCATCTFQNETAASSADATTSPAPAATYHSGAPASVEYFVVGTAHVINGEAEPSRGRLLVFEIVANRRVHLIAEKEVKGGVFSLAQVCGRLAAGVGSKVSVYNLIGGKENLSNFTGQPELLHECTHSNQIMSLYLKAKGDNILVGDLVRSMTLLRYKPNERTLQEIARDFNSSYLRGVEVLDGVSEDIFVGTDISGNLHCLRQQSDAVTDEERSRLEPCGEFHVGDYLNAFRRGSLVGQPIDTDAPHSTAKGPAEANISILSDNYQSITGLKVGTSCLLYGGVSGSIGNVISLSEDSHRFFAAVERVMKRTVMPTGGLNHRDWRSFQNDLRVAPQRNMIDGDLVEMLLDFDRKQLEEAAREINDELNLLIAAANATGPAKSSSIVASPLSTIPTGQMLLNLERDKLQLSVEDIVHRIEDISRLH